MPVKQTSIENRSLRNAPMFGVVSYLLLGVGVATFGPLKYQGYRVDLVLPFMLFVIMAFSVGYVLGSRTRPLARVMLKKGHCHAELKMFFCACLFASILLMSYEILFAAFQGGLSFSFSGGAENYFAAYTDYERNSGNYSAHFLLMSIGALPLFTAQVLGILYFKDLSRLSRLAVVFLFVSSLLVYVLGGGKQKQFGDIIIYVVSVVIAKQAMTGRLTFATLMKVALVLCAGISVLLALLTYRYRAIGVSLANLNEKLHPLMHYQEIEFLNGILNKAIFFPIVMFSGYLGQGYYGLALSLEQPFTWTCFAGSSYSVSVILNRFFGVEFWVTHNYPYLVGFATDWNQSKWHTVFSWLASDLTFPGVIVFMGFIGFLYGRVWREILLYRNPLSVMVFAMMNIGWAYAPANNQLMHSPGALFTTLATLLVYFCFHVNFNVDPTTLNLRSSRLRV
ncbi:MAG: hypothetical protein JW773_08075 [Desulfuromonadales bacterium]|nr:hypothetical protein [Desulfuromonadales bacterium]